LPESDFTARVQAGQQSLGQMDLDALPQEFVGTEVVVTRRPLKDRITAALKAGQTVTGAQLLRDALPCDQAQLGDTSHGRRYDAAGGPVRAGHRHPDSHSRSSNPRTIHPRTRHLWRTNRVQFENRSPPIGPVAPMRSRIPRSPMDTTIGLKLDGV
jgi:hypothetical protein